MSGFRKFLLRGNLVDLAVAVVIGAAFGAVVSALVADILTPLLGAIGGTPNFSRLTFHLHHSTFFYGKFLNALISFVIIAAILYFLVIVPVGKLLDRFKPAPDEPAPVRDCSECLSSIPQAASRCAYCGQPQQPVVATS
jgi:large conductance mechanosensitive channel